MDENQGKTEEQTEGELSRQNKRGEGEEVKRRNGMQRNGTERNGAERNGKEKKGRHRKNTTDLSRRKTRK